MRSFDPTATCLSGIFFTVEVLINLLIYALYSFTSTTCKIRRNGEAAKNWKGARLSLSPVCLRACVFAVTIQGLINIEVVGTCHGELEKAAVLKPIHIQRYKLHVERGLSFEPPEVRAIS